MKNIIARCLVILLWSALAGYADLQYRIEANGTATVTNYTGIGGSVIIPPKYIIFPVASIDSNAFWDCASLDSVIIPDTVTKIGDFAFEGCRFMTNVTMGKGVTSIGRGAFYDCHYLTSVIVPDGVKEIRDATYMRCWGLGNVTVGPSVEYINIMAFADCPSLTSVFFKSNAPGYFFEIFQDSNIPVVYYRAGSTGWSNSYAGRPTAIWPEFLQAEIKPAGLSFRVAVSANQKLVIESCTNMAVGAWAPVSTNTSSSNTVSVTIPDWSNAPLRYYRATLK